MPKEVETTVTIQVSPLFLLILVAILAYFMDYNKADTASIQKNIPQNSIEYPLMKDSLPTASDTLFIDRGLTNPDGTMAVYDDGVLLQKTKR